MNFGDFKIRNAIEADIKAAIQIDNEVFVVYGTAESPEVISERFLVFPEGFWIVETDITEQIVGYASTEKWSSERPPALNESSRKTHIFDGEVLCITAAVISQFQNKGIGTRSLGEIISFAKTQLCRSVVLETAQAKRFYERQDFQLIGTQSHGQTLLYIMKLSL